MSDNGVEVMFQVDDDYFTLTQCDIMCLTSEEYRELQMLIHELRNFISNYKQRTKQREHI